MELRHLRYFIAVAEEGSLTVAAEQRLRTAQPSLSRQMRDLEYEVGVQLLTRSPRGVELTAAGEAFLVHARLALNQADAAVAAAQRAAQPAKSVFALGFLTGQEMDWLPDAMNILKGELPNVDVTISSQYSPQLAAALAKGSLDLAFLRPEPDMPELTYTVVIKEPLVVVLPNQHRLASHQAIAIQEVAAETFVGMSRTAPSLRQVIETFLRQSGVHVRAAHEADNLGMALSLVASTGGVTLLPLYARNFLPPSVISRPLAGAAPTIDLVIGYRTSNPSPLLRLFLSRIDDLISRVGRRVSSIALRPD